MGTGSSKKKTRKMSKMEKVHRGLIEPNPHDSVFTMTLNDSQKEMGDSWRVVSGDFEKSNEEITFANVNGLNGVVEEEEDDVVEEELFLPPPPPKWKSICKCFSSIFVNLTFRS